MRRRSIDRPMGSIDRSTARSMSTSTSMGSIDRSIDRSIDTLIKRARVYTMPGVVVVVTRTFGVIDGID